MPVQVLSQMNPVPGPSADAGKRAYSLYSTDSDSTVTGTRKALDKVTKLISLLLGREIALDDDFDETIVANQVLDNLKRRDAAVPTTTTDKATRDCPNRRRGRRKSATTRIKSAKERVGE